VGRLADSPVVAEKFCEQERGRRADGGLLAAVLYE
jgi:hypothetical protein